MVRPPGVLVAGGARGGEVGTAGGGASRVGVGGTTAALVPVAGVLARTTPRITPTITTAIPTAARRRMFGRLLVTGGFCGVLVVRFVLLVGMSVFSPLWAVL
jgi:hypothetical protein